MSSRARTNRFLISFAALLIANAALSQSAKPRVNSSSPLAQAKIQLAQHDLKGAEDSIWQVLSPQPENPEALLLLGLVRAEQQRYPEAESLFQKVVQLDPQSATARVDLGKTLLSENKLPAATEQYKQAEQLAPQNVEVRVTLARLYAATGDCSFAMTSLEAIPAAHFPPEAIPVKAGCLLALGHQDDAMKLAQAAKTPPVQLALAEVFLASKLPQESLNLLDAAAASGKRPPARFYLIKGRALDATGDQTGALENFQKALALEPNSEEVLLAAAELYARQSKHLQAFEMLQKAYKVDPNSPTVVRPLILEASFAGKSGEVQDAAEQLAAKSDEPQDLYVAAGVFLRTGRQADAVPLLEKYLAKMPDDARAWTGLGVAYAELKRSDDAQKAFERALQADPKFFDAEYQLGLLAGLNGSAADATKHFERVVEINPNHAPSLEKLGNIYLESGQFEKARELLTKAEGLDPTNRQVEYGLALAYSKLGNREEAKIHMERFQKAGPIGSTENK
jgi:tetratricopeptide (TPR) repeat protein